MNAWVAYAPPRRARGGCARRLPLTTGLRRRGPLALEEGELAHGGSCGTSAHAQMWAQASDIIAAYLHEATEVINSIDHVRVLLDDVGEKLRVDKRDRKLLV